MRAACAALLAGLVLILAACGSSSSTPAPQGDPDARHGTQAVDYYASVELLRALLIASSDGYYTGGSAADAEQQLQRARQSYDVFAGRVRAADPVLDHEVVARFDLLANDLRKGVKPDHYRDLAGPLTDQLMQGVAQTLVPTKARRDQGLTAEALRRVTGRLAATYDASTPGADDPNARLAFQQAWGLWRRALALTAVIKSSLGGEKGAVSGTLNGLRGKAFKNGPVPPGTPPASTVDRAGTKVVDALVKRYALGAS